MRTSGSRSTPVLVRARRVADVRDQRLDVGGARAALSGLTMKFACFSDTRAPPIAKPLRPAALDQPRRMIAVGGLRNTLPAFGSAERLGRDALREQLLDARARVVAIAWRKAEPRRGEDAVARRAVGALTLR